MKKITIIAIIFLIACNSNPEKLSNKIYNLEDFPKIGWGKRSLSLPNFHSQLMPIGVT